MAVEGNHCHGTATSHKNWPYKTIIRITEPSGNNVQFHTLTVSHNLCVHKGKTSFFSADNQVTTAEGAIVPNKCFLSQ